ncbi:extradiol ring-cleavage dioxygenase [Sphingopyxis sp. Root214]|uniref:DODA-type extradiol aromatic ring-opening family dioxygenase n=1 Tax=unclassified Sphingopyxis TaxID=2614943 RepID=UPI0006F9015F|nr:MULTISPECIES: class III extradiol ring-cleavage dioxygenase [unclassified Sphingopyxis]KQZ77226.1 extradiol ring-cleavage dioxygenase [Sphingopyxis sp. Root154]KRC08887.1 extradiol ring-cleavage dioxygenase [Sphingopyxis sp. Root214]
MRHLPSLFLSHGSPMMALEPSPARTFLAGLGAGLPRPRAILVVSAHHDAAYQGDRATVTASPAPPTIHDFGGFPDELFAMCYPAPGDPLLATRVVELLAEHGLAVTADPERGLDHGAWVPLSLIYPDADIPVVQLSIASNASPEWHYALGQALAPLRDEDVLIIGSGSITHNLRALFAARLPIDAPAPAWITDFTDWIADRMAASAVDDVLQSVERAPHGRDNHPTPDHILPLFVAMGAGGAAAPFKAERLHASVTYGLLAMDVYAFD